MTGCTPPAAEALFERLVTRFSADPSVTPPTAGKGFGASGLKVEGKIFAMLSRGELVVKLPRQRVDELVASGTGRPFDPGHGRVMKEWVTIRPSHGRSWVKLAEEAQQFVAAAARPSRRR
jgi:TfoX/Sxy family transcriptional regulator of competence genes